ncbi:MAG: hypothetical protein Q9179_002700 [Wetmoreana sp. 5 TL-2023]
MSAAELSIPESLSTVDVHIIDSTSRISGIPTETFMEPKVKGYNNIDCPAFSFLIEHPKSSERVLFDLGVRKDWENLSASISKRLKDRGWSVTVEKGVAAILKDNGVEPKSISAIIWSHFHWDHIGDPSTFPHSVDLVVGPGFKDAFTPGYPTNQDSPIHESDYADRKLREISFESDLQVGGYKAFDYFGDGSFYLLDSPGHAIGHICGLARLFIPVHRLYDPSNRTAATDTPTSQPFLQPSAEGANDVTKARDSVRKMSASDGRDDVLVMIAHDAHMLDVVRCFPDGKANSWKEEGWKAKGAWRFLKDFEEAVKEREKLGRG